MSKRTEISLEIVTIAAALLIATHPKNETTTLEVKNLLRYLNVDARQGDVSSLMAQFACDAGISVTYVTENGNTFIVYNMQKDEETPTDTPVTFQFRG